MKPVLWWNPYYTVRLSGFSRADTREKMKFSIKDCFSKWFGHIYWRNPQWKTSFFVQWEHGTANIPNYSIRTKWLNISIKPESFMWTQMFIKL